MHYPPRFFASKPIIGLFLLLAGCAEGAAEDVSESGASADLTNETHALGETLAPVKQLVLGRAHGCSLDSAISGLLCWGDNSRGQTRVPALLLQPRFVAAGGDTTCAIANDAVRCWGDNSHRQRAVPSGLRRPVQVAVGGTHACALTARGDVRCWGDNAQGQLDVPALSGVRSIAAGEQHSCALTSEGVRCWGDNTKGQLDVPELQAPEALAVGGFHSCAIDAGEVVCWGGDDATLLEQVPTVRAPTLIAAGAAHSCVADESGVQCWGAATAADLTPRELTRVKELAVGGGAAIAHACARHQQGIACWGDNSRGQTRYDGGPLHLLYRAEAEIAAPTELVWDILMDLENYGRWNPYTIAMESTLQIGAPMVMTVKMNELLTLTQTENIRVLEPGHKACWGIDTTTPELNSGERCQWLEPLPDGGTRYVTEDLIEGTLNPLVSALFDADLRRGFDGVARGLKQRAEQLARP